MDDPRPETLRNPPDAPPAPSERLDDEDLIVVGIGASAGGLEAFTDLFRHLPPTTGMAFVLVQHLDPRHESALPELLSTRTRMQVIQVQGDTTIVRDRVYVIPPNTQMLVRKRVLTLEARPESAEKFRPIDAFFESLANEFRFCAVGVVLSGTATDGTLGLKTIKAEGGITFAQNQTAKFDSMPRSAIAAGVVDFVLSPRRIAEELVAIGHRTRTLGSAESEVMTRWRHPAPASHAAAKSHRRRFHAVQAAHDSAPFEPPHDGAQDSRHRRIFRTSAKTNRTKSRRFSTIC